MFSSQPARRAPNKYRPDSRSNARGKSGEYVSQFGGPAWTSWTKFAMTVTVKAIESQR
jgi:hypothetical protein